MKTTPIYGIFSEYVLGLKDYGEVIKREDARLRAGQDPASLDRPFLDFRKFPLEGATAPDRYTFRIRIKGRYPQWGYWMATTFMAPRGLTYSNGRSGFVVCSHWWR